MKIVIEPTVTAPVAPYRLLSLPILVGAILLALAGCATGLRPQPVAVPQVIKMSEAGVPSDRIIRRMRDSGTTYRLKASQLADLAEQGVPGPVIDYMQRTYLDAVRRDQQYQDWNTWVMGPDGYWYGGCGYGWGPEWCT
jgi:hypothetical protein